MSDSKLLVALLVAAMGVGDAALLAPAIWGNPRPNAAAIVFYGLIFGQVGLCGIWSALAEAHGILRGMLLGVAQVLAPLLLLPLHGQAGQWFLLVGVQLLCVVIPLSAIRAAAGLRLAWLTPVSLNDVQGAQMQKPLQFSLLHILVAVTVIAVLLGMGRAIVAVVPGVGEGVVWGIGLVAVSLLAVGVAAYAPNVALPSFVASKSRPVQFTLMHVMIAVTAIAVLLGAVRGLLALLPAWVSQGMIWELGLISASLAVLGLAATWPGLGTGPLWLRGAVFVLIVGVVTAGVGFYFYPSPDKVLALIMAITAIELALALSVLRIAGFRLVRRSGHATQPPAAVVAGPLD